MEFNKQVKYVRMKLKLTQAQLSELTKIPLVTIKKWETHDITPQMANYGKFIEFCEKNNIFLNEVK